jgi:hypothetical protein
MKPISNPVKLKFTLKYKSSDSYSCIISNKEDDLIFALENLKNFL